MERLGRVTRFVWAGWAGLAGLMLLCALWQAGHEAYGSFILPPPLETFRAALKLMADPANREAALGTFRRAGEGFVLASCGGFLLGLMAGYSPAALRMARPLLTLCLGVPPIAWIVLAMIWFGTGHGTVLATVMIAVAPVVFVGTIEGVAQRDRGLDTMCEAFGAGPIRRFWHSGLPQAMQSVFPAATMALGLSIKVAVMAELLANAGGIGRLLATARSNLDVTEALAWVMIAVGGLIVFEYGVLHPLRSEYERWREAARPWGVKR
jgi:NitT/TauT family transport system permease protein